MIVEVPNGDVTTIVNHAVNVGFVRAAGRSGGWSNRDRWEAVRWLLDRAVKQAIEAEAQP